MVHRKQADPICFGSKLPRTTDLIGKGLSPFQKRDAPEINPKIGPGYYRAEQFNRAMDALMNKVKKTLTQK